MHLRRVAVEQFGQALTIAAGFLERLLLTAVLVRTWGTTTFEVWSVCIAISGLMSLFDLGFSLYFGNRLMEEKERECHAQAARTLLIGNTLFAAVGVIGFIGITAFVSLVPMQGTVTSASARIAVVVLAAGAALRLTLSGYLSLYRANRQYSRLAFYQSAGEAIRILAAIAACLAGANVLGVAVVTTAALIAHVVFSANDAARRFGLPRLGFAVVSRREAKAVLRTSLVFFAQMIPIVLLPSLPVLYLGRDGLGIGVVAAFVLMRTFAGVPRALLQQFGTVLGQECGRRIAVRDSSGALKLVAQGARLYAVLSGVATGLLLAAGPHLTHLWIGDEAYFRLDYVAAAITPMLLSAFGVLAHNILTTTNAPWFGTLGRWMQLLLTVIALVALPFEDAALGMLVALSVGELIGFLPWAYYGVHRLVPGTGLAFHVREVFATVGVAAIAALVTLAAFSLIEPTAVSDRVAALSLAILANGLVIYWLGFESTTRRALQAEFLTQPLVTRVSSSRRTTTRL